MKTLSQLPGEPLWKAFKRSGFGATDILDHFGVRSGPVDVFGILEQSGVFVNFNESAQYAGASVVEKGDAFIWVKRSDPRVRQRFTAAHEFGHLILHNGMLFRDYAFEVSDPLEWAANRFAADLLMPVWLVRPAIRWSGGDVATMAKYFEVSEAAMSIRYSQMNATVR